MYRLLIVVAVLAAAAPAGWLYGAYGEIAPCRVLAAERAEREAAASGGAVEAAALLPGARLVTEQMGTGACVSALFESWRRP